MTATDQYQFWRRRLAGEVVPIHADEPQAGFYRTRFKSGPWQPVAIWFDRDGGLRCRVGADDIGEQIAMERWPWFSKHPISHDVYKAVIAGGPWPDEHAAVVGDNQAPADDSFDALQDRITDLAREADKLIKGGAAKDQAAADQASHLANRLGELWSSADNARKIEKRPHDEAAKEVQRKWAPLLDAAEIYKRIKAAVIAPFLVEEDRKRRDAEAAARKAAEEAARRGQPIVEAPPVERSAPKAGASGRRAVHLRTVKVVALADRDAVLAFFKDNERITEVLQSLAERAVAAGVTVPGVKITEEQRAA